MENEITIITSDNIIFNVSANIRNILQAPILNSNPVKLNEINSETFSHIINYCSYHNFVNPAKIQRSSTMNDFRECLQDQGDFELLLNIDNYEKICLLLLVD